MCVCVCMCEQPSFFVKSKLCKSFSAAESVSGFFFIDSFFQMSIPVAVTNAAVLFSKVTVQLLPLVCFLAMYHPFDHGAENSAVQSKCSVVTGAVSQGHISGCPSFSL